MPVLSKDGDDDVRPSGRGRFPRCCCHVALAQRGGIANMDGRFDQLQLSVDELVRQIELLNRST
jgi:hypothetical protein